MDEREELLALRRLAALEAKSAQQTPATSTQKIQASAPMRVLQGMRDPIDAAAQMLPRGLEMVTGLGGLAENPVSRFFGSEAKRVDQMTAENERAYNEARKATGQEGMDIARLAGNVVSPVNAAVAARLPAATTMLGRAGVGAAAGAAGGALTPVQEGQDFAQTKAAQIGLGAVTGGILSPVFGKISDVVGKRVSEYKFDRISKTGIKPEAVEQTVQKVLRDLGYDPSSAPNDLTKELTDQVRQSMIAKARLSPAEAFRAADFEAVGIKPTLSQITRDPRGYAQERNLRQIPGVGDPLLQRFEQQGQQLQGKVGRFAEGAQESQQAGASLAQALRAYDEQLGNRVTEAYKQARAAAGKDVEVPLQGLAQDFADIVDRYRTAVPSGIRGQFAKYGLDPSEVVNQRKLFTVEEADKLLKEINKQRSNEPAVMSALSELRGAVKKAVTQDAGVEDVFAPARKLAAERFSLQDAIPALEAASTGAANPDDFVRKFVLNGKTNDVQKLAQLLKAQSPADFDQARAQIGAQLQRAAFGENVVGDKAFSPERYAKALRDMGSDKLKAFFSPGEVSELQRLGRVGAYINSMPNASPVNTSGNWGAITNLASRLPGVPAIASVAGAAKRTIENDRAIRQALQAQIPNAPSNLTPEQISLLGRFLSGGVYGAGAATAQGLNQ